MTELSVLMPVRNGAATVERAIRSTLRSMPDDSELAIWDDASSDGTLKVIRSFGDRRVRVVSDGGEKRGPAGALQALLAATQSRYVARMDADDVSLPWRFTAQLAAIRRQPVDILFSSVLRFRTEPFRLTPSMPLSIPPAALPLHLAVMSILCHPTMMARRGALESVGGYRPDRAEDYDLWLRASSAGLRLARAALPVLAYRRHAGQTSAWAADTPPGRLLIEAYRDFAASVLGVETEWVPGLAVDSPALQRDRVRVESAVRARAAALPSLQRHLVDRTLTKLPPSP